MYIKLNEDQERIFNVLETINATLNETSDLELASFNKADTLIVFVDVINGFIGEGVYSNPLAKSILDTVDKLSNSAFKCIALSDDHSEESLEFEAHPVHALAVNSESDLHESLINKDIQVFKKDSINGFFAKGFKTYFDENREIKNVIVAGLVTDICVLNFCMTLKTYCNQLARPLDIHIPMSGIESFELEGIHNATLMNLVSASMMMSNGIKLYKGLA